jgi:isopenicillin N synthase-like dioxygenase
LPTANHVLRIIHYPPSPTGNVGAAHRDFDLLTVSVEGTVPGLEIYTPQEDSVWRSGLGDAVDWTPQETGVQVGEMLEEYTQSEPRFSHGDGPALTATTTACAPRRTWTA